MTFLVGYEEGAVGIEADTVGGSESTRDDLCFAAVLAHLDEGAVVGHESRFGVSGGLGVVEIAIIVGLQAHGELMEVFGDLVVVVDRFVVIGFAVTVEVAQDG